MSLDGTKLVYRDGSCVALCGRVGPGSSFVGCVEGRTEVVTSGSMLCGADWVFSVSDGGVKRSGKSMFFQSGR
jgi:hypothetical protein